MARAHFVQKARKDNPAVKKGESYWWWQFRGGGKRYSATRPRGSQLTQSVHYSTIRAIAEMVEDWDDPDDIHSLCQDVEAQLEERRDECQESLENMPESLQYAPTGEMLQERIDACDAAIMEVQSLAMTEPDEEDEDWLGNLLGEIAGVVSECEV